ncbi:TIGR02206 family membrane protein [Paenibacillus kribbensis]|uniref:YwaF family protein n=1 Tax=Paenibacillus kribbensis TaxID=172713 RepID=UPI002DB8AF14|nr:TIGR02206 family membrane protein [Paenibacillus kribbensis]MEC0233006.1 TIGR02206 family membrane protein [Paenibacillus kribbensis]
MNKPWSESWFDAYAPERFEVFTPSHVWAVLGLIVCALLLWLTRGVIRSHKSVSEGIRWFLMAVLFLSEVTLNIWYVTQRIWDAQTSLPLELCSVTLLLSILMLFFRSRWLYPIVLFAGIGGALQAVLTPNLAYAFPHYRFIHFFVAHSGIILAALYMTWIEGLKPTWKSVGGAMLFLNGLALFVWIVDTALGANYMFLAGKPSTPSILDVLGPYPVYILAEEVIALLFFSLMMLLFEVLPGGRLYARSGTYKKTY